MPISRLKRYSLRSLFVVTTIAALTLGYWRWHRAWVIRECKLVYTEGVAITMVDNTPTWWPSFISIGDWSRRPSTGWVCVTRVEGDRTPIAPQTRMEEPQGYPADHYRLGISKEKLTLVDAQRRIDEIARRLQVLGTADVQLWMLNLDRAEQPARLPSLDPLLYWSMTERKYNGGIFGTVGELEEFYRKEKP